MSDNHSASPSEKRTRAIVIILTTAFMGLAAVATAFSGYQASVWNGKGTSLSGQANAKHAKSAVALLTANQMSTIDVQLFSEWLNAYTNGDDHAADFYRQHFRPEAKPAFEKWLALDPFHNPDAPSSPFVMSEYNPQKQSEASQLETEAGQLSDQAGLARQTSQEFSMNAILLASASFFAGMASRLTSVQIEIALTAMSGMVFAWALFRIILLMTG